MAQKLESHDNNFIVNRK